jgi:hypothetical protein
VYFRGPTTIYTWFITTFVIENNVSPLKYLINIVRQTKPSLIEQKWYIIWWVPGFVCLLFFVAFLLLLKICRAPLNYRKAWHTYSTKWKIYTIYNRDRCTVFTNWRQTTLFDNVQMYMYLGGGSRHFHKGDPFYFRNHFFYRNIKRYRDVIQSKNYKTWWKEKWQGRNWIYSVKIRFYLSIT